MQFDDRWLTECANDLMSKPGASLVVASPQQPVVVQLMAYGINAALKNVGTTLLVRELPRNPRTNSILQLAAEMNAGRVKQLFIIGGDPVYNAPRGLAEDRETKQSLNWEDLQKKVPEVVRVGYYEDATSAASKWHVPGAHYLESWGDALTADGGYLAIQPMILPLFGGVSDLELLNALLGRPKVEGPELVQETFRATAPPGDFDTRLVAALARRFRDARSGARQGGDFQRQQRRRRRAQSLGHRARRRRRIRRRSCSTRSYAIDDGRYINNGWLQELPDPITKLTWDNAALMSPTTAKHFGVDDRRSGRDHGHGDERGRGREAVATSARHRGLIVPGHADHSISIALGYGRRWAARTVALRGTTRSESASGRHVGFNAYLLRTSTNPHFITADDKTVKKCGGEESRRQLRARDHAGSLEHRRPRPGARSDDRALSRGQRFRERRSAGTTNCRRNCRRSTAIRR